MTNPPFALPKWLLRSVVAVGVAGLLLALCGSDLAFSTGADEENGPVTVKAEAPFDTESPTDSIQPPPGSQRLSCEGLDAAFDPDAKPIDRVEAVSDANDSDPTTNADPKGTPRP